MAMREKFTEKLGQKKVLFLSLRNFTLSLKPVKKNT